MSIAQGRYEPGMPVRFCTDGVELSAHSKPRPAASIRFIAEASGKRATPNSEARLMRKKVNFDDSATTTSSSRPVASQGQCHAAHRPS